MRELGDKLTPKQVVKLLNDSCILMFGQPSTYVDPTSGKTLPLSAQNRSAMAQAFLDGAVARLSQWWRDGNEPEVAEVMNTLDEDTLHVLATAAVAKLGDLGYTIAAVPDPHALAPLR